MIRRVASSVRSRPSRAVITRVSLGSRSSDTTRPRSPTCEALISSTYTTVSPKLVLNTRSLSPVTARVFKIVKSCDWNSLLASGFTTSVSSAVVVATARPARNAGRKRRRRLTPAALQATISRSPASRPPARSTATRRAIGRVWARKDGSMKTSSCRTRWNGTPFVMTSSVRL